MMLSESALVRAFRILDKADRRKLVIVTILQTSLAILDLLGVLAIGLLGIISVDNLQSQTQNPRIFSILRILHLSNLSFQTQATLVGLFAVVTLIGRTLLSVYFTRRILHFLSRRGAMISAQLISRFLAQPLLSIQSKTSQNVLFSVTNGVSIIALSVLATTVVLISDLFLLVIIGIGLAIVDYQTAIVTFMLFSLVWLLLHKTLSVRAKFLGVESTALNIKSNEKVLEVLSFYREAMVGNRRDFYSREIGKLRYELAESLAEISFLPYISKYVIESSILICALLIGSVQVIFQDASQAIGTLGIFLAAGTRIAPALLRVQQATIQIRTSLGQATPTLDLINSLNECLTLEEARESFDLIHQGFEPGIHLENLSFTYPGQPKPALSSVSLEISTGMSVALVGPSGAGKTTLVDVILGILAPDVGTVTISGLAPQLTVSKWPGAISYVPQEVVIARGSIRDNVALGYPLIEATDERVINALSIANLGDFVSNLYQGLDTDVGERGANLSGGQRQRLGVARAMFTNPRLLVLDEATSSLDAETEDGISRAISALRGNTTVIMVAHRLSTVKYVDKVVYMDSGKVVAVGNFEQVRTLVPDFDNQARLMGL
jgi:ABC-type multidrug transport system fused ATPase/permease subunit